MTHVTSFERKSKFIESTFNLLRKVIPLKNLLKVFPSPNGHVPAPPLPVPGETHIDEACGPKTRPEGLLPRVHYGLYRHLHPATGVRNRGSGTGGQEQGCRNRGSGTASIEKPIRNRVEEQIARKS